MLIWDRKLNLAEGEADPASINLVSDSDSRLRDDS